MHSSTFIRIVVIVVVMIISLTCSLDVYSANGSAEWKEIVKKLEELSRIQPQTPEEEYEKDRNILNYLNDLDLMRLKSYSSDVDELESAVEVKGFITVDGICSKLIDVPFCGQIPEVELQQFTVRQNFVGNLYIKEYLDSITKEFVGEKEYRIDTMHTGIKGIEVISYSGKACVKFGGFGPMTHCAKSEPLSTYSIPDRVSGSLSERELIPNPVKAELGFSPFHLKDRMVITVNTERVKFKPPSETPYLSAGGVGGCLGEDLYMAKSKFEESIKKGRLELKLEEIKNRNCQQLKMTLYMLIDPSRLCEQIDLIKNAIALKDYIRDLLTDRNFVNQANNPRHLYKLVTDAVKKNKPVGTGDTKTGAEYNPCLCKYMHYPDLCTGKNKPACYILEDASMVHEQTHEIDTCVEGRIPHTQAYNDRQDFCGFSPNYDPQKAANIMAKWDINAYNAEIEYLYNQLNNLESICR